MEFTMDFARWITLIYMFLPVIFGGIFNMVFMKLPILTTLKRPMDGGLCWLDGKRIFGDNKTWKGFVGMVGITVLFAFLFGAFSLAIPESKNWNIVTWSSRNLLLEGLAMGLGYALAELPNSFLKRRFSISPGTNRSGISGFLFLLLDQADSAVGAAAAMLLVLPLTLSDFLFLSIFGAILHYVLNVVLFLAGLRKQAC